MTQATHTLEFGGSSMAPLDAAAEYLRTRLDGVLPLYVWAMAPHAVVTAHIIEAIAAKHGGELPMLCIEIVIATIWRWIWLSRIQANVQAELSGKRGAGFWRKIFAIIVIRLFSSVAITWGSFLILPGFVGLFTGSFAAPLLLESEEPVTTRVLKASGWIMRASKRLFRVVLAMTLLALILTVACFVTQYFVVGRLLSSLFGFQSTNLELTLGSTTWILGICYLVFLVLDLYWTVLSVVLYDDSRSQRMATDLFARLAVLTGGAA